MKHQYELLTIDLISEVQAERTACRLGSNWIMDKILIKLWSIFSHLNAFKMSGPCQMGARLLHSPAVITPKASFIKLQNFARLPTGSLLDIIQNLTIFILIMIRSIRNLALYKPPPPPPPLNLFPHWLSQYRRDCNGHQEDMNMSICLICI